MNCRFTRNLFACAALLAVGLASSARADYVTALAVVTQTQAGPAPTVGPTIPDASQVSGTSFGGNIYGNRHSGGATAAIGDEVILVGVDQVTGYHTGVGGVGPAPNANFGPNNIMTQVFALRGTIVGTAGGFQVNFDSTNGMQPNNGGTNGGFLGFFSRDNSVGTAYTPTDPKTWGYITPGANANDIYRIAPRMNVFPGLGESQTVASSDVNLGAANAVQNTVIDAFFVFQKADIPGAKGLGDYIVDPTVTLDKNFLIGASSAKFRASVNGIDAGDLTTLNTIAMDFLGTEFALAFGPGNVRNFEPTGTAADQTSGDLTETAGVSEIFVDSPVPEPSTYVLCGMALATFAGFFGMRRLKQGVLVVG